MDRSCVAGLPVLNRRCACPTFGLVSLYHFRCISAPIFRRVTDLFLNDGLAPPGDRRRDCRMSDLYGYQVALRRDTVHALRES
jgi:hypothetical protein